MNYTDGLMKKHREAILYIICGGFTTLVAWVTYALFVWLGMELNVSNILSWICGLFFAFAVNKWIVFCSRCTEKTVLAKEFCSFCGARIFTGVIAIILFPILYDLGLDQSLFGTAGFMAKITTSILEIALNWIFSKYYVFKRNPKDMIS
jgi:putative flippase GtrA